MFDNHHIIQYDNIMYTIPLRPLFENEKFKGCTTTVRFAIVNAIYKLGEHRKLDKLPPNLQHYFEMPQTSYFANKRVLYEVLLEVAGEIIEAKKKHFNHTINCRRSSLKARTKHKKELVLSDEQSTHVDIIPVFSPHERFHPGFSDHVERDKVISAPKSDEWLKDD